MAKLSKYEREDYKVLKAKLKARNLQFIQDDNSGVTIAKCDHDGGNFERVAIAYCSRGDKFNRKRGKFEALIKLDEIPQYMLIPKVEFCGWGTSDPIKAMQLEFVLENI